MKNMLIAVTLGLGMMSSCDEGFIVIFLSKRLALPGRIPTMFPTMSMPWCAKHKTALFLSLTGSPTTLLLHPTNINRSFLTNRTTLTSMSTT